MNIRMNTRRAARVAVAAAVTGVLLAVPQLATAAPKSAPDVPSDIAVPAGNVLSDVGHAEGFQIYSCQTGGWVLQQPQAVLRQGGHKTFALHYAGPSWTAMDGSTVVGTKVNGAPDPSGTSIPWLLLKATPTSGPAGGTFASTTFIQRINTTGGVAPTTGCDSAHIGATTNVFYTADYYFYRAA